jgi:dTDP-4-amino-4,6-dideoxygalactose transaminase
MAHFEETRPNKWIWIFDCQGMKTKDLIKSGVAKKLAESHLGLPIWRGIANQEVEYIAECIKEFDNHKSINL